MGLMNRLITVLEAARFLRKRKSYVYEAIYRGELTAIKTSTRGFRIRAADLESFVAGLETRYYVFNNNPPEGGK